MKCGPLAATAAAVLVFSAAQAAPEQGLASAILNCATLADEKAQLACYNGIAAQVKAAQASAPVTAVPGAQAPASPQDVAQAPKQEGGAWYNPGTWFGGSETPPASRTTAGNAADFGNESLPERQATGPQPLDHITAKVTSVSYNYFRRFTVTLDNGQIWRQIASDTKIARFDDNGSEAVTISRGFLESFSLAIEGRWGAYQVKRIK